MAKLVEFNDKEDLVDSPEVDDKYKCKAEDLNDLRDSINQKISHVDSSGKLMNLAGINLSEKRLATTKIKVQLQDNEGKPFMVETTPDQVYINESLKLDEVLGGNSFFLSIDDCTVEFGNFQEWIAKGKPKA